MTLLELHLQIDDDIAERVRGLAAGEARSVDDWVRGIIEKEAGRSSQMDSDKPPLWGLMADEPEILDQIVQDAMRDRESRYSRATHD